MSRKFLMPLVAAAFLAAPAFVPAAMTGGGRVAAAEKSKVDTDIEKRAALSPRKKKTTDTTQQPGGASMNPVQPVRQKY